LKVYNILHKFDNIIRALPSLFETNKEFIQQSLVSIFLMFAGYLLFQKPNILNVIIYDNVTLALFCIILTFKKF